MKKFLLVFLCTIIFTATAFAEDKGSDVRIRAALSSGRPTVVDFGAGQCIPCKRMKPILDSLAREFRGRANVIFVDIKDERNMAGRYHIQLIPTQVFFDAKGKEVKRHMGFMDKPEIISVFKELSVK